MVLFVGIHTKIVDKKVSNSAYIIYVTDMVLRSSMALVLKPPLS